MDDKASEAQERLAVHAYVDLHGDPVRYDGVSPVSWRIGAYVLVVREGRVLMVEPGHTARWELPGGGVEVHELLAEGAARECLEETGYRFVPAGPVPFHVGEGFVCWNQDRGFFHVIAAVMEGAVVGEVDPAWAPDPTEIRRSGWVAAGDLTAENTHPNFWPVLRRAGLVA